ncbi:exp1-like protein [Tulasnella sp. JGI-2019a]|nr:exp1-like protein [Tulasnella sp. JGI-2019a]
MLAFVALRQSSRHSRLPTLVFGSPVVRTFAGSTLRLHPTQSHDAANDLSVTPFGATADKPKVKATPKKPSAAKAKATDEKKARSVKKVKEVKIPKKPVQLWTPPPKKRSSPVALFIGEKLAGHKGRLPLKDIHAEWKALSEEEKSSYVKRVSDGREGRLAEYEAWEASLSPEAVRQYKAWRRAKHKERIAKKGEETGTVALKKPPTAYIIFATEHLKKHYSSSGGGSATGVMREAGQAWSNLTLGEKAPYVARAEEQFKAYQQKKVHLMEEKLHHQAHPHPSS